MARPSRIERPGAWYHVTNRGVERRVIYADNRDRRRWLALIEETLSTFGWVVHAHMLMDNHYHLILQRGEEWDVFRDRHSDWGRELALFLERRECGSPLRELGAAAGGMDYAAVSVAIKRFARRLAREKPLRQTIETVKHMLNVEI